MSKILKDLSSLFLFVVEKNWTAVVSELVVLAEDIITALPANVQPVARKAMLEVGNKQEVVSHSNEVNAHKFVA